MSGIIQSTSLHFEDIDTWEKIKTPRVDIRSCGADGLALSIGTRIIDGVTMFLHRDALLFIGEKIAEHFGMVMVPAVPTIKAVDDPEATGVTEETIRTDLSDEHIDRILVGEQAETVEELGAVEQPIRTDLTEDEVAEIESAEAQA